MILDQLRGGDVFLCCRIKIEGFTEFSIEKIHAKPLTTQKVLFRSMELQELADEHS